jgi:exopolysaccharide production protein ExoQ
MVLLVMAPMAAPVLVPALGLTFAAACLSRGSRVNDLARDLALPSRVFSGVSLLGAYLLISASWSPAPAFALRAAGLYLLLVFIVLLVLRAPGIPPLLARAWPVGVCIGLAGGSLFLLVEVLTGQAAVRAMMSYMPVFLDSRHAVLADGWIRELPSYRANRAALVLALALWPALLIVAACGFTRSKKIALRAALLAGVAAIALSDHETSKMSVVGATLVFLIAGYSRAAARFSVMAGWLVATALVVPLAGYAHTLGLHHISWLPESATERVLIWRTTAEQVGHAPILGGGIGAARSQYDRAGAGTGVDRHLSLHSHNAFLQVWFETGAVGAGLLFVAGALILGAIGAAPSQAQPFLYAAFAASALMAATSYSIWAPWFMACLALVPVLALVGVRLIKEDYAPDTARRHINDHEPQLRN